MAKKKSSKKSSLGLIIALGLFILAIVSACMIFLNACKVNGKVAIVDYESIYKGTEFIFGKKNSDGDVILKFNIVGFLGLFLPLIGSLLFIVLYLVMGKSKGGKAVVIPALCFIAGAVLAFLSLKGFLSANEFSGTNVSILGVTIGSAKWSFLAGPIIAGCVNVVGAILGIYGTVKAFL